MDKTKTITIDPTIFISGPYDSCPKCKKPDTFGVSTSIGRDRYTKKCKSCFYSESFRLPKLDKKIIYIDQFAISDMMKAINKREGKTDKVSKEFLRLFSELDSLVKAQLILCPDSEFHREESMLHNFRALKRMYEHLSNATSLYDPLTIKRFQITEGFKKWLRKQDTSIKKFDVDSILHGDRNGWQDKFLITVDFKIRQKEIDDYKNSRSTVHEKIKQLFEEWKRNKPSFKELFEKERSAYGPLLVRRYAEGMSRMLQAEINNTQVSTDEYISFALGESNTLITSLMRYLPDTTIDTEKIRTITTYFKSDDFKKLPFNTISSSLWAAIEYQVSSGGRLSPPNIGMVNDIEMVSTLLPYCDAILLDRDMFSILNFGEVKKLVAPFSTKIFSLSNKDALYQYLESIKKAASKDHFQIIERVYGSGWNQPFYEMYD